jgi:hypothetical protein
MKALQTLGLALIAFIMPLASILLAVGALCMAGLALGIGAARKRHKASWTILGGITSKGLKHTVAKLTVYEIAIILAFVVQTLLLPPELPIMSMLTTLIGLTELKSCLENLDIIYGEPFFKHLIKRLTRLADSDGKSNDPQQ